MEIAAKEDTKIDIQTGALLQQNKEQMFQCKVRNIRRVAGTAAENPTHPKKHDFYELHPQKREQTQRPRKQKQTHQRRKHNKEQRQYFAAGERGQSSAAVSSEVPRQRH